MRRSLIVALALLLIAPILRGCAPTVDTAVSEEMRSPSAKPLLSVRQNPAVFLEYSYDDSNRGWCTLRIFMSGELVVDGDNCGAGPMRRALSPSQLDQVRGWLDQADLAHLKRHYSAALSC